MNDWWTYLPASRAVINIIFADLAPPSINYNLEIEFIPPTGWLAGAIADDGPDDEMYGMNFSRSVGANSNICLPANLLMPPSSSLGLAAVDPALELNQSA